MGRLKFGTSVQRTMADCQSALHGCGFGFELLVVNRQEFKGSPELECGGTPFGRDPLPSRLGQSPAL